MKPDHGLTRLSFLYPFLFGIVGIFLASALDAIVKATSRELSILTITAWRFTFGGILVAGIYVVLKRPKPTQEQLQFHAIRGALQLLTAIAFFFALTKLSLAETTVLAFMSALIVPWLARVILDEPVSKLTVVAGLSGLLGAIIAVSGETAGAPEGTCRICGIASVSLAAFCYALVVVLLRLRSRKEDTLTLLMFSNAIPGLFVLPVTLWSLSWAPPAYAIELPHFGPILLATLFAVSAWWFLTMAYSRAPAQYIAPLDYTALIWSAVLGAVFFGEQPGWRLWVGASIIIGACILVALDSRFATRRQIKSSPSDILT